jgi:hypothetical protein
MDVLVRRQGIWERSKPAVHAKEDAFQQLVQDVFPQVLASQFDRPSVVAIAVLFRVLEDITARAARAA